MKYNVMIDIEKCKKCQYCVGVCKNSLLKVGDKFNSSGYHYIEFDGSEKECTGCKLCAIICPEIAIKIEKEEND